jgi:hypothetical protein
VKNGIGDNPVGVELEENGVGKFLSKSSAIIVHDYLEHHWPLTNCHDALIQLTAEVFAKAG